MPPPTTPRPERSKSARSPTTSAQKIATTPDSRKVNPLTTKARSRHQRLALERPQTQGDEADARPVAAAVVLLDEASPAQGREQAVRTRLGHAEGQAERRDPHR